tara:strand:+ start:2744 stop:3310 length:567 start_codon:yes stop_codon:yes gene_type:complete
MKILTIILIGILTSFSGKAQSVFTLNNESSTVVIKGTSNIDDWETKAETVEAKLIADLDEAGSIDSIKQLTLNVDVESIKSGKGIMDGKTYSALEGKKHPQIIFELSEITEVTQDSVFASGVLTIAGKPQTIQLATAYQIQEDFSIKITGTKNLLMTDFGVKPPKALFGTLKTKDEIEIVFDVIFQKN